MTEQTPEQRAAREKLETLQFGLMLHNTFGQPADQMGFTVERDENGKPFASRDGKKLTLLVVGDTAVAWQLDGDTLVAFELRGRGDPKAIANRNLLLSRFGS